MIRTNDLYPKLQCINIPETKYNLLSVYQPCTYTVLILTNLAILRYIVNTTSLQHDIFFHIYMCYITYVFFILE